MRYFRKNAFTLEDKQGYIKLDNEYNQHVCVSFNRPKKEMTVISSDGQRVFPLGDLLVDFIALDDDGLFQLFEEDRLSLIEELPRINQSDFEWDFSGELNEFTENYIKQNNISKDDFAKKLAIFELIERYENLHPYLTMLDFYTCILHFDNNTILNNLLDLKTSRNKALNFAEFCFDIEDKNFKKLSAEKRYYFYSATGRGSIPQNFKTRVVALPNKIPSSDYSVYFKTLPDDFDVSKVWELSSLHDLKVPQDICDKTIDHLKKADVKIYEAYEVSSIPDLVYLELYQMVLSDISIKRCGLCGKHFVLKGDYKNKYCDRIMPGNKRTCQQIGSSKDYNKRVAKSPAQTEYMRAYKRMHSRIGYSMITKQQFIAWQHTAKENTKRYEQGEIDIEELKALLRN